MTFCSLQAHTQVNVDSTNLELQRILDHRRRAQEAVDEQERKLAELTALQAALRSRLNELERAQDEEEASAGAVLDEDEDEDLEAENEDVSQKLLDLIAVKTADCEQVCHLVYSRPVMHCPLKWSVPRSSQL